MTTSANQIAERRRRIWPAAVLPLLAAEILGVGAGLAGWLLVLVAATLAIASPKLAARLAPFACLLYAGYGFWLAHYVQQWNLLPVVYGIVRAGTADNAGWLVPQAFAFMTAGVLLLALTNAPGGRAVRQAFWQLRGTHGQRKTVPPLLLLAVIFLWEEMLASVLWFPATPSFPAPQLIAQATAAIGVAMLVWRPRAAAVTAVAGTVVFGVVGVLAGTHWALVPNGDSYPAMSTFYGAVSFGGGPNPLALIQGIALTAVGCALAPRLLTWKGDAELAKRAQALTQRVGRLTQTRSDATEVAVAELRRIERDLHDGAQARLVAVGMSLRAAEELMRANPEAALALVAEARETSSRALDDLRGLVRGIYPPVLADRGLADAVRALALDAPLTVDTDITLKGDPPMPVAAAVYFGIAEALTNAVRHAGADSVQIGIGHSGGMLRATITDDGHGGADPSAGTGLSGVERRLATFDGILAVTSPAGGPTIVILEVPCELSGTDAPSAERFSWQTIT